MTQRHDWAVVLAGGEGARLRALTRLVAGDERPKQFCRLLGQHTLLAAMRQRVGLTVNPNRILYVVSRHHERFYRTELEAVSSNRLIEAIVLMRRRCLWNTFMLVGQHHAFVALLEASRPGLFARCVEATSYRDPLAEAAAMDALYADVPVSDFSQDVLTMRPDRLGVITLPAAGWTDLGQPARVLEALAARGRLRPVAGLAAS